MAYNNDLSKLEVKELLKELGTTESGLTNLEAKKRKEKYGSNDVSGREEKKGWRILLAQFLNPLVLILIISSIIAAFLGEFTESIVILAIVVINSFLGFFQEYKAEHAVRELMKHIISSALVYRDNKLVELSIFELIPGDVVKLHIGDIVPADIRLIQAQSLTIDESALTGESLPADKEVFGNKKTGYPSNMVFMGTSVSSGLGDGVVVGIGKSTEIGKTREYLKKKAPETDFEKNIRKFGNFLMKLIIIITLAVIIVNLIKGEKTIDSFLFALALAVGITPEMLPIIITVTLSNNALKLSKEKVIVKELVAVEDLGNIDVLCCDKTGTLTEGKIKLINYFDTGNKNNDRTLLYGILCNDEGNAIDKAILEHPKSEGIKGKAGVYRIIGENEFDFERKRMSTLVGIDNKKILIAKGSYESIISICAKIRKNANDELLSKAHRIRIDNKIKSYEQNGYKVIAVAEKKMEEKMPALKKEDEAGLILIGFLLFSDVAKKSAKEAIEKIKKLGVFIKILSGDSPLITRKICNDVGLKIQNDRIILGDELDSMDEEAFKKCAESYNIFAKVTPSHKYKIVEALSKSGHVVGFLGDGVNDAPALKSADVGISVNTAAGVAKEAASIILLHKSLNVLAEGILLGRKTFGNIMKYILNTISANFGNMFTVAFSTLFVKFIPLLPSQILLNNFASDIPLLTIATDNVDSHFVHKPKQWNIAFIRKFMVYFGLISTFYDLVLIALLLFFFNAPPALFRTAWFVESALSEILITFSIRSRFPFYKSKPSKWLIGSSIIASIFAIGITYLSIGGFLFEFVHMPLTVVLLISFILAAYFATVEFVKKYFFSKNMDAAF